MTRFACYKDFPKRAIPFSRLGLAKLGNIVAETMFLVMFPGVAKLGNICFGLKICVREAKMFLTLVKNIFCFRAVKLILFPQHTFPSRLNWETFASATMFPSLNPISPLFFVYFIHLLLRNKGIS